MNNEPKNFGASPEKPEEVDDFFGLNDNDLDGITPVGSAQQHRKFEVHIDDEPYESIVPEPPKSKGEIYFANRRVKSADRPSPGQAPAQAHLPQAPAQGAHTNHTPGSGARGPKKSVKSKLLKDRFVATFLAVVLLCSVVLSAIALSCVNDVLALHRSEDKIIVNIPKDATTNEIIDILSDNGLIHQKLFCKLFYGAVQTLKNRNKKNVKAPVYLSGVYYIKPSMGLEAMLSEFKENQQAAKTVSLVFPEGWTIYQIIDKIDEFGVCSKEQLLTALKQSDYEYDFISQIPESTNRTLRFEGYFFPDTYEFFEDSDPNSVIRKLLENSDAKWSDEYEARSKALGLTRDEVLIIASIIQREAANAEQMPLVSSVIHNRLNSPASWPFLGCDSTSDYVKKYVTPNVSQSEANNFLASYNTGKAQGLPPGPICNPGLEAIDAALYPKTTDYYYFCHDKFGQIYMASTQSEFDANLLKVLNANNS